MERVKVKIVRDKQWEENNEQKEKERFFFFFIVILSVVISIWYSEIIQSLSCDFFL